MILKILLRILFITFTVGFSVKAYSVAYQNEPDYTVAVLYTAVAAIFAFGVVFFEWRFQRKIVRELVAIVFGLAAGLVVATLIVSILIGFFLPASGGELGAALATAFDRVQPWIPLLLVACCYLAITVVLQTKSDFRFLIPYVDFSQRGTQEGGLVLDTSALIDGRIVDLCETRLVAVPVVIPDFVIRELQTLADSSDRLKRTRGRRGLDLVARLQKSGAVRVVVRETDAQPRALVDDELVRCAKEINGRIVTTDFNLNKVSEIEGIPVVNVNDIAKAVKPAVLPGDVIELKIVRPGQEAGQGVGYLDDGTMVVVENARDKVGETLSVAVTGSIQTSAGRMVFGRLAAAPETPA